MKTATNHRLWAGLILSLLLFMQTNITAQTPWYQNQDGRNQPPNGTIGTAIKSFTPNSFVACYLWNNNNDDFTWKISKSHINGKEQKTFFVSGSSAQVEMKVGPRHTLYLLERSFPLGQNASYSIYKLDSNFMIKAQTSIVFPNEFSIINLNAFQVDDEGNVYLAGDGQYPNGPGYSPASFVLKADKNLVTQWNRMDSTQTSYTQLLVDRWGRVTVIADFYSFFPDIYITRISANGKRIQSIKLATDPGRFNLFSTLDDDEDDLLLYGGKFIGDTAQAMFLYKISGSSGRVIYRKTHFTSISSQVSDLKIDGRGNIFTLVSQYLGGDRQVSRISRINSHNGQVVWNRIFNYAHDSCNFYKLVVEGDERFYAVGEKRSRDIFSKGLAIRMRKNGVQDGNYLSPDSIAFSKSHWLVDGIMDRNNELIAIGGTNDVNPETRMSSYLRSFAVGFRTNRITDCRVFARSEEEEIPPMAKTVENLQMNIYPNPVQDLLTLANLKVGEYNRINVYNMEGMQVSQQPVNGTMARMNVAALPNGVYLLVLKSQNGLKEKTLRFVISK